jgi:hypothetical protein
MVTFNEAFHTYTNTGGENYISVTTLLSKYKPPFDAHYWSTYKAMKAVLEEKGEWDSYKRKAGGWDRVVEFVRYVDTSFPYRAEVKEAKMNLLQQWNENKTYAASKGTAFHKKKESESVTSGYQFDGIHYPVLAGSPLAVHDFEAYGVYPELVLYDDEFKLAGQADVVIKAGKNISIIDYKTSRVIEKEAFQEQKLLYPLDTIPNANFYIYSLQLSLYGLILERQGYEVGRLQIEHVNRETHDLIERHEVAYLRGEAENVIRHYCEERDKKKSGKSSVPYEGTYPDPIVTTETAGYYGSPERQN